MAGLSEIEWTDATWNPVAGCKIISPGCSNCYAMRMAARLQAMKHKNYLGTVRKSGDRYVWTGKVVLVKEALNIPLKWRKPKRIFVNSMSDLFQDGVPDSYIRDVWATMEKAHWHHYQILTKRPDNMERVIRELNLPYLPQVWIGTSIESAEYNSRLDYLRAIPNFIKFISFEPLIDSVKGVDLANIDWAIVGGESGPKSRPIHEEWVDEIKNACDSTGTAFFFKQWGGTNKKATGRTYRGRTWDEYPVEKQVA